MRSGRGIQYIMCSTVYVSPRGSFVCAEAFKIFQFSAQDFAFFCSGGISFFDFYSESTQSNMFGKDSDTLRAKTNELELQLFIREGNGEATRQQRKVTSTL